MKLPLVPQGYSTAWAAELTRRIAGLGRDAFKRNEDLEIRERFILVSPDGTKYSVTVANNGALITTAI